MGTFHQVVLLTVDDVDMFGSYLADAAPAIGRSGGGLDRAVAPEAVVGDVDSPSVVNVVHYDSRAGYEAMLADPEFVVAVRKRDRSTRLHSIEGEAREVNFGGDGLAARRYLIEIASFGPGGRRAYDSYDAMAREIMGPYGYRVELMMDVSSCSPDLPVQPDVVKVACFDSAESMRRFEADPRHQDVEGDAYAAAVRESIWVLGSLARADEM